MKKRINYLSLMLLVLTLASCKKGGNSILTPVSSGRPYEILVVMDKDLWERPAGRALFDALDTDVPGLPQSERSFRISQVATRNYDRTFSIFRNIIMPDIQNIYTQTKFKYSRDVNAAPQMIMTIQAPNEKEFEEYVQANKQVIVDFFTKAEMNRQVGILKKKHSKGVSERAKKIFDCDVFVPDGIDYYKERESFFWASTNKATDDLNFVMYSYPFTDKSTFTLEYFVEKRDSVMKKNLPGAREGMYMATDTMYVVSKDIAVKGKYAQEVKGLWHMTGDMMGGPFVSHVRVDEKNGRVIVAEAFVYAPHKLKRDLIRRMEAALYTLQLPDEKETGEALTVDIQEEKLNEDK